MRAQVSWSVADYIAGVSKVIVPAPGADKLIVPIAYYCYFSNDYSLNAEASSASFFGGLNTGDGSTGTAIPIDLPLSGSGSIFNTSNNAGSIYPRDASSNSINGINTPLTVIPITDAVSGTGTITLGCLYDVVDIT